MVCWRTATFNSAFDPHAMCFSVSRVIRKINSDYFLVGGPGSSVGIESGYGLDGLGIESRWGRDFPHLSRPALGPTQPPVQ
jgi:hypothetical protein